MYTSLATAIRSALHDVMDAAASAMQDAARAVPDPAPAADGAEQQRSRTDDIVSGLLRGVLESLGPALVQRLGVTIRQPNGTTEGATGGSSPPAPAAPQAAAPPAPQSVHSFPVGGDDTDEEDVREPADKRHKPAHGSSTTYDAAVTAPSHAPEGPADVPMSAADVPSASVPSKPAEAGPSNVGPKGGLGPKSGLGPKGGLGKGLGPALPPKRAAKRTTENATAAAARAGACRWHRNTLRCECMLTCTGMAAMSDSAPSAPAAAPEPVATQQLGPSAAAAPPLGDLLGSLMGALNGPPGEGGQGGLDGLMQMAAQVANSPAMQNVAQQLAGGDGGRRGGGAPPNIGSLMQSMMPLMQGVLGGGGLGGGGRSSRVVDMAQVGQQLAAILGEQAAREWIQRMEADVEAMATADDPAPLSSAYQQSGGV